jgi:hypothetical protein
LGNDGIITALAGALERGLTMNVGLRGGVAFAVAFFAVGLDVSPARADQKPHCWCKIVKSDCGACSDRCVVRDFGAIAQFRVLQQNKDGLCKDACAAKLASLGEGEACAGLASGLRVPMPWSGELHGCARVGASGKHTKGQRRFSCTAQNSAPAVPAGYWKLTFADEFKGKPANATPEVAACYDRTPKCIPYYLGGLQDCPAEAHANLRHLDKCTWTTLIKNNWMMKESEVNAFDARAVTVDPNVDDGVLILSAHGVRPDGSLYPAPAAKQNKGKWVSPKPYLRNRAPGYDCVWIDDPWSGKPLRSRCSIISGAVLSQDQSSVPGGAKGFKQKYGKFVWRAKMPYGPGSFPALWMLPQSGHWPSAGEIDILESYKDGDYVNQGYISGVCAPWNVPNLGFDECKSKGGKSYFQTIYRHHNKPPAHNRAEFWAGYHTFGVEWDPDVIRFTIDGVVTKELKNLDLAVSTPEKQKRTFWNRLFPTTFEKQLPIHIPDREYFLIMNQTVKRDGKHEYPNPAAFVPQKLMIDWVRAYQKCATVEDFCPIGGTFETATNRCTGLRGGGSYVSACSRH